MLAPIWVALGQTLRLNVVATPPNPCLATVRFVDTHGLPIGPPIKAVALNAGEADFLDLNGNTLVTRLGPRVEVRPVVTVDGGGVASVCASTPELVDQFSGFTTVLLKRLLARMTFCRMSRSLLVACPTGA